MRTERVNREHQSLMMGREARPLRHVMVIAVSCMTGTLLLSHCAASPRTVVVPEHQRPRSLTDAAPQQPDSPDVMDRDAVAIDVRPPDGLGAIGVCLTSERQTPPGHCRSAQGTALLALQPQPSSAQQIIAAMDSFLSDGLQVWEPTPNGRSCRQWTVHRTESRGTLQTTRSVRVHPTDRSGTRTILAYFELYPSCGELEIDGCGTSVMTEDRAGGMHVSGTGVSDTGTRYFVDDASASTLRIGPMGWFRTQSECLRSPLRAAGALVTCPR